MHRGELGAGNLNQLLQEALTAGAPGIERGAADLPRRRQGHADPQRLRQGGLERRHRHVIEAVDARPRRWRSASTTGVVEYSLDELDELVLAYAATVHKSQGSEYPAVVIPVHTQHYVMLQRNLLYTAVTRGKRLVVLVGTRKALGIAVRNADVAVRCSGLGTRLARLG